MREGGSCQRGEEGADEMCLIMRLAEGAAVDWGMSRA